MANSNFYTNNPISSNIKRSTFDLSFRHQTSIFHGDLVPILFKEVLPSDEFSIGCKALTKMTPPIAPIMDSIYQNIAFFYIPKRLVFNKTKEFYGENVEGYGIQSEILEPRSNNFLMCRSFSDVLSNPRCLANYAGLVRYEAYDATDSAFISQIPLRCFYQIYNDWFRSENFMPPYTWNHDEVGDNSNPTCYLNGIAIYPGVDGHVVATAGEYSIPKVCKKMDRFTSCLPWSQKASSAVLLPLGDYAPIDTKVGMSLFSGGDKVVYFSDANGVVIKGNLFTNSDGAVGADGNAGSPTSTIGGSNLVADLSNATASNINQIRMAFATQRYFEALARGGSKYREYIQAIFNTSIGDTTAQMAEYLGGISFPINVAQVLQTTGHVAGATSTLAAPGATSTTFKDGHIFFKGFAEPGFIIGVCYFKHDRTYGQGLDPIFTKHEIWDYYQTPFAHIGEQGINKSQVRFTGLASDADKKLGFQEAYSEYRTSVDKVSSFLNPANTGSIGVWNLSENFGSEPILGADFLEEDRDNLARCLTNSTGLFAGDYLCDFWFDIKATRPLPVRSVPGLVDHF